MGLLDDVLGSAVPGGSVSKPLLIALTALLGARATGSGGLGSLLGGGGAASQTPPTAPGQPQPSQPPGQPEGGFLGGLGNLVQRFQQSGHGDIINSWIGPGQNRAITPEQLHQALGPEAVNNCRSSPARRRMI